MKSISYFRFIYRTSIVTLLFWAIVNTPREACAQFTDISEMLGVVNTPSGSPHGHGLSYYDFNYDGWDDLTLSAGTDDVLFFENNNGVLEPAVFNIPNSDNGNITMVLWADYDSDGDADLLITKFGEGLELWNNDGDFNFTEVANDVGLQTGNFEHTGAAFCDYNHDGCLDLYVAKFYHPSFWSGPNYAGKLYQNNCDGTFTDITEEAGVYIPPRPTFQPVFLDYNNDGWEDLLLVIDRVHWPNELFLNNGDGTFTQVTADSGFDFNICAMTGTVDDYDNDGDLDVYITNNPPVGNVLMQNNGDGTFNNIADEAGVHLVHVSWGSVWLDYDNDSWQDLFISVTSPVLDAVGNQFFVNNLGVDFTQQNDLAGIDDDPTETYICARGDLNNDGYFDLALNNTPQYPSKLYINEGGNSNYLSVSLQGTISNRDGIGSWIHCYAGGEHYVRFTLCGENLCSQNSRKEIFGLGDTGVVDSLVIDWNMGTHDVYQNLQINEHHQFVEGASITEPFNITVLGDSLLCPNDSVVLDAGEFDNHVWNTGEEDRYLTVFEPGTYYVTITNSFGNETTSFPISIEFAPEPELNWTVFQPSCFGEEDGSLLVEISTGIDEINWNNGGNIPFLDNLSPGVYSFDAIDTLGCHISDSTEITSPDSLWGVGEINDVLCYGEATGTANFQVFGGNPPHNVDWQGLNPNQLTAGEYSAIIVDWNNCQVPVDFTVGQPDSLWLLLEAFDAFEPDNGSAEIEVFGGTTPYEITWSNGSTDVYNLNDLPPGDYNVFITDSNDCTADTSFTIDLLSRVTSLQHSWLLFPNPASDALRIEGCEGELWRLRILNTSGQLVYSDSQFQCASYIDLTNWRPGVYILQLQQENRLPLNFRFIKQSGK